MVMRPLTVGDARFRAGEWRGHGDIAYLVPLTGAHTLTPTTLQRTRSELTARGFSSVITAAVGPTERDAFTRDDFTEHDHLHLLRHDLMEIPSAHPDAGSAEIKRGRRRDHHEVLRIDEAAFDDFWRLDRDGLLESMQATPVSRFRVVHGGRRGRSWLPSNPLAGRDVFGYSVSGRAGVHGYLQRLAVDPMAEQRGLGTSLVVDTLAWMKRRGAATVLVNTQRENHRALALYERTGFIRQPDGLVVLERPVR